MKLLGVATGLLAVLSLRVSNLNAEPPGNPLEQGAASPFFTELNGRVIDSLSAGSYRYVLIETDSRQSHWLVTLGSDEETGGSVHARIFARADSFESRRLHRQFAPLLFASLSQITTNEERNSK